REITGEVGNSDISKVPQHCYPLVIPRPRLGGSPSPCGAEPSLPRGGITRSDPEGAPDGGRCPSPLATGSGSGHFDATVSYGGGQPRCPAPGLSSARCPRPPRPPLPA